MRKLLILFVLVLIGISFFDLAVAVTIDNPIGPNNINELVVKIADGVATVIGPLALVMFIVSGIFFLASAGNPERINTAKTCLVYAVIGAAVALAAKGLAELVAGIFT